MNIERFFDEIIFHDKGTFMETRLMWYFLRNMKKERLVVSRDELMTKVKISNTQITNAINHCVEKGWLIHCVLGERGFQKRYLMLNTPRNRQIASRAERIYNKHTKIKSSTRKSKRPKIPAKLRIMVLNRDKSTCVMCGRKAPEVVLHVDHIVPVSEGGTTTLDNLQTLCADCNLGKSDDVVLHVNAN